MACLQRFFFSLQSLSLFQLSKLIFFLYSEKEAQVSIYHISWEKDFGFCCQIDDKCARELSGEYIYTCEVVQERSLCSNE